MWAILIASKQFSELDLKIKDISVLKNSYSRFRRSSTVYKTKPDVKTERCVIEGEKFKYAFLVSDITFFESMKDNINEVIVEDGVYIDFIQLYKMIEVASELPILNR